MCVLRHPDEDPSSADSWYKERLTLWQTRSHTEAIEMAEAEAREHADAIESEYVGLAQSFWLFSPPTNGAEVFSLIRGSNLNPTDYLNRFFDTGREMQGHQDQQ
jgi:hypothetical protein